MTGATPRPASTVAVVRDAPGGLEVLLLQRAERGDHNSGAWVFPGGLVDAGDREAPCAQLDDAQASRQLRLPSGGRAFWVAAIRECFEEAGLLFATDHAGRFASFAGEAAGKLAALRPALHGGQCSLAQLCQDFELELAPQQLHYVAHWLTPVGRTKRFDTRFFVAVLPPGQVSAHDADETLDQVWIAPRQALAPENTRRLMTPTRAVLQLLARFPDTAALIEWAREAREVECVLPRLASDGTELRPVLPHEPAWYEAGRLDPEGRGQVQVTLQPHVPVRLSPRVLRITAEDGESNSYLVSDAAQRHCLVLGPASGSDAHLDALLAAAQAPIAWIVHGEGQAGAAARLQARCGAGIAAPGQPTPVIPAQAGIQGLPLADAALHILYDQGAPQLLLPEEGLLVGGGGAPADAGALECIAPARGFLRALTPSTPRKQA